MGEGVGVGGKQILGNVLPGEYRGFAVLHDHVHVRGTAQAAVNLALGHRQIGIVDGGGQGKALVDMELLIRRGVRGQHHVEQDAQRQHKAEDHPVQGAFLSGEQPPSGPDEDQSQQGDDPVELGHKSADLGVDAQDGQHALGGLAIHGQAQPGLVGGGGVADEQPPFAGVVGG